ncbi:PadR family transcriptional regulator [Phytoactinopolyspora mesophila]|uniref:PadR family transcriptional regulator n=1 Tax=Phytoactinopolyspora mesophila TaxID=2650750 RepID=A0A7K3M199_9ACTN|nr:PadR family transcriptional regulator [Phytoactinopolyspora mesophila]NDL57075.1 PadR family transcriptional regulator [Phytoactinopolyspora mesophila]
MALRHAVLAALVHGEASGYELAKRFELGVANFWHAKPQQVYAELARLSEAGLVQGREVIQESRPNKRMFAITDDGLAVLAEFAAAPKGLPVGRDDLMIAVQAIDTLDAEVVRDGIERRAEQAKQKLATLQELERQILGGRDEATFVRTSRHLGPYLNCRRGIRFQQDTLEWCEWALQVLRSR